MIQRRDLLKLIPGVAVASLWPQIGALAQPTSSRRKAAAGTLGMNLAPVTYWSTEHPFQNLATSASRWRLQEIDGPFRWDMELPPATPSGYPLAVPAGTFLESFLVFTIHRTHLPDLLTVSYDGIGVIEYLAGGELVQRRPGQDVIRNLNNEAPIIARLVSTSASQPLTNVRISDGEDAGIERFRPAFLDRLSSMAVLRFMDWMETNNSHVTAWDHRPRLDRYSQTEGGVAPEIMIELCNRLNVSPWFTMPHLADDDYIRRFAELARETLRAGLAVHVEYSNEVWNALFEQSQHSRKEGLRLALSTNEYEAGLRYYSQRTSEILAIWEGVFGAERDRVIGVYAAHGVNAWTSEVILSWGDARQHADVLAVAPYFGGSLGSRDNAPTVSGWSLDRLFAALEEEIDGENRDFIVSQAQIASRYGLPLVAYEGGQHLVAYSGTGHDDVLHPLFEKANRDPRMGDLYRRHIGHWRAAGGSTYTLFNSMGTYSKWGCWGLLEHERDMDAGPKWQAVQDILNA